MAGHRLTHREMLSYGFKQGEPWADQRRDLERALDRGGRQIPSGISQRSHSMSSGLPAPAHAPAAHRQHSTSSTGHSYTRNSGYGSTYSRRAEYPSPSSGRSTYAQDPWAMQLRADPYQQSVSSRHASPAPSYAPSSGRSYSHGYAPSSSYAPTQQYQSRSHGGSSRYSGYGHGYASSGSSSGYAPRSYYETEVDDDDDGYTHVHAPSAESSVESEPHVASSGYVEANFVIEPSDSGSEASYSGGHGSYDSDSTSGSGYSGSEGDSVYSDGADDEYDDDDGGSYSDDGGYYSDD